MSSLDHVLAFSDFLRKFREVERSIYVRGNSRNENDVEHSYTLAMLAWYIIETYNLDLDMIKVFEYALIHDIVEIYAGDTPVFKTDPALHENKHERERQAVEKIGKEFPEIPKLREIIARYENRQDKESKFIYGLDKIEPTMAIYLDRGKIWKERQLSYEMIREHKLGRNIEDETVQKLLNELLEKMKQEEKDLF